MSKRKKQKSPMIALLIGGGVLAYFLFTKKNNGDVTPIDNGTGGGEVTDDGTGTGTQVIQPPPITASTEVVTNLQTAAAINDRAYLLSVVNDAKIKTAVKQMNDAETISMYNYMVGYAMQGKKLYQYPNASGIFSDGGWDTTLYNQILAIKSKYNISI